MDPRVRRSPYHDPPENEVFLSQKDIIYVRARRVLFLIGHLFCLHALYLVFSGQVHRYTLFWSIALLYAGKVGITAGAHRLWSHNAFKATVSLRIILMLLQTVSFELSAYGWSKIHRIHHKYCDTDSDPVNATRGFFFSHCGWLLILEHPDVKEKNKTIWMEDLHKDKVVMFQHRNYPVLVTIFAYIIPVFVPWYFWNESLWICNLVPFLLTTVITKHITFCVNSVAHIYGMKPYNKNFSPRETNPFISWLTVGEGWHNFHHAFPWDYRNSEFVGYANNLGCFFIDMCASLRMAYDLKTVSEKEIVRRVKTSGDGTHCLWGWNDEANTPEKKAATEIKYPKEEVEKEYNFCKEM
ncbi:hypothetical protein V9T40_004878 [Parthenolecanium corni]|uniref:Fatty acid desaturase domain-containing protein n=1 Tax=Parthenolecanium corni TaxID=536013 RepID=A0AAN9TF96_9HEMI